MFKKLVSVRNIGQYVPKKMSGMAQQLTNKRSLDILQDPHLNKGTGFNIDERERLGLRGLLPNRSLNIQEQKRSVFNKYNKIESSLDKYSYLSSLQSRNETLFFDVVRENITTMAPILYTPTVGLACQQYAKEFRRAKGMWFSADDVGHFQSMMYNWPSDEVDVIVVTDGSRILGLGDLGANGMGIPVGKLILYCACAGINPNRVLPVMLDLGTDNKSLLEDPFYNGINRSRLRGDRYIEAVDEFMDAVRGRYPHALVQFEDFSSDHANMLLDRYTETSLIFNDDIQGTASTILSGVLSSLKVQHRPSSDLKDCKIVVLGAGSAGCGVADGIAKGMRMESNISRDDACSRFYMLDVDGLITSERKGVMPFQKKFADARTDMKDGLDLMSVIEQVKPDILIGLSGQGGQFKEQHIKTMAKHCDRPVIFPCSNPTANAECTAEQVYDWTDGRGIFAAGSPFDPFDRKGKMIYPSQGNNMYIFPGLGQGVVISKARVVNNNMLYRAALAVGECLTKEEIEAGRTFPALDRIVEVSRHVAIEVARQAFNDNVSPEMPHEYKAGVDTGYMEWAQLHDSNFYEPKYDEIIYND